MAKQSPIGLVDYALAALHRIGGAATMVDIEDIAVEAHRLAPDRFRWRKHDFPNLELVRVVLSDANKGSVPLVLWDERRKSRMLTKQGAERAQEVLDRLSVGDGTPVDKPLRRRDAADLARMEAHPAYRRWTEGGIAAVDAIDLADLVLCAPTTPLDAFRRRLLRAQAAAAHLNRQTLARFLGEANAHLPQLLTEADR